MFGRSGELNNRQFTRRRSRLLITPLSTARRRAARSHQQKHQKYQLLHILISQSNAAAPAFASVESHPPSAPSQRSSAVTLGIAVAAAPVTSRPTYPSLFVSQDTSHLHPAPSVLCPPPPGQRVTGCNTSCLPCHSTCCTSSPQTRLLDC